MYWFEEDDFDEFHDFYLLLRRKRLKRMEMEAYAAFGKSCLDVVKDKLRRGDVKYIRYDSRESYRTYIYARASVETEIFHMTLDEYNAKYGESFPEYLV